MTPVRTRAAYGGAAVLSLVLALAALPLGGCLINADGDKIVRRREERIKVAFESEGGLIDFQSAVRRRGTYANRHLGSSQFFIPFIISVDQDRVLSRDAFYNDEVRFADLDGDRTLSDAEVGAYVGSYAAAPR